MDLSKVFWHWQGGRRLCLLIRLGCLYVKGIITSHMHTFLKGSECQKRAVDKKQHLFLFKLFWNSTRGFREFCEIYDCSWMLQENIICDHLFWMVYSLLVLWHIFYFVCFDISLSQVKDQLCVTKLWPDPCGNRRK